MASPLAAGAAPKGRAWALLDRIPEFISAEELPGGIHYVVNCAAPPELSTLRISRARALLAAGGDAEELVGLVHCTDGEGHILVSVWSASDEQGRPSTPPRLFVCRPGTGSIDLLPPMPEHHGVLDLEAAQLGSIGIVPGPGGGGDYLVALLRIAAPSSSSSSSSSPAAAAKRAHQHAGASSSSSAAAPGRAHPRALVFSSTSSSWTAEEVRPRRFDAPSSSDEEASWAIVKEQEQPPAFEADGVLCHDVARHLVFVDAEHGLVLVLDPQDTSTARFVPFPVHKAEDDDGLGLEDETGVAWHLMASSKGRVCLVGSVGGWVKMWYLQEDWEPLFDVSTYEILNCCLHSINFGDLRLTAVDPTDWFKLTFLVVPGEEQSSLAVTVAVDDSKHFPETERAQLVHKMVIHKVDGSDDNESGSWAGIAVIWWYNPAAPEAQAAGVRGRRSATARSLRWMRSLGGMARSTFRTARKHIPKAKPFAKALGKGAERAGIPYASMIVPAVEELINGNEAACVLEELVEWFRKPSPSHKDVRAVGTMEEGNQMIEEWIDNGKPDNISVRPAPGLSQKEQVELRRLFKSHGAESLLLLPPSQPHDNDDEYEMVSTAAPYFPSV